MYKWDPSHHNSTVNLSDPIYGFSYEENTAMHVSSDVEGLSQYQPSLLEHQNESPNLEFNPMDVFDNAIRFQQSIQAQKPPKQLRRTEHPGYSNFAMHIRQTFANRSDLSYNDITRIINERWGRLTPAEQDNFSLPHLQVEQHVTVDQQLYHISGHSQSDIGVHAYP